jgi:tartrate-resistant acid phosphatase type 5
MRPVIALLGLLATVNAAQTGPLKFAIYGDWGVGPHFVGTDPTWKAAGIYLQANLSAPQWGELYSLTEQAVVSQFQSVSDAYRPQFVLSTGDQFYDDGLFTRTDPQFQTKFKDVYTSPGVNVTWYPCLGNHDYYQNPTAELNRSNDDWRWYFPSKYYNFSYYLEDGSEVLFVVLDVTPAIQKYRQESGISTPTSKYYAKQMVELLQAEKAAGTWAVQLQWAQQVLSSSRAPWKFVMAHEPIYASSTSNSYAELQLALAPILEANGVSAVFAGHYHTLDITENNNIAYIISGATSQIPYPIGNGTAAALLEYFASHPVTSTAPTSTVTPPPIPANGTTRYPTDGSLPATKLAQNIVFVGGNENRLPGFMNARVNNTHLHLDVWAMADNHVWGIVKTYETLRVDLKPAVTAAPTPAPTTVPTPTQAPTAAPTTAAPTQAPTNAPTTLAPTQPPTTAAPTRGPGPTQGPTTVAPTAPSTVAPTTAVPTTGAPTGIPIPGPHNPCARQVFGGIVDGYNLWSFGSWHSSSSAVGGAAAVAGSATLASYSIASAINIPTQLNLIVGGSLQWVDGALSGTGLVGGAAALYQVASAGITSNSPLPGPFGSAFFTTQLLPVTVLAQQLTADTLYGSRLTKCGSSVSYSTWTITAPSNDMCRVVIDGSSLSSYNIVIQGDATAVVVVVISGYSWNWEYQAMTLRGGITAKTLLWVSLCTVGTINLAGVGFYGSLLAPYASVSFNNGIFNGQLIAGSVNGNGALSQQLFCATNTPRTTPTLTRYTVSVYFNFPAGLSQQAIIQELTYELSNVLGIPTKYLVIQLGYQSYGRLKQHIMQAAADGQNNTTDADASATLVDISLQQPSSDDTDPGNATIPYDAYTRVLGICAQQDVTSAASISSVNGGLLQMMVTSKGITTQAGDLLPTTMCADGTQRLGECPPAAQQSSSGLSSSTVRVIMIVGIVVGVVILALVSYMTFRYTHRSKNFQGTVHAMQLPKEEWTVSPLASVRTIQLATVEQQQGENKV